ncbi:neutral zinc metallopeptidase [Dyadobacter sp. CY326]|uniref:neutral zinc metallopeptidase n=1 Tax=Dyadobacter sp. CY326 TaxID=2907300 RepID=UPI001F3EC2FC|nr:neutral zinc metallopeptidase [Dyadobacter sp. CY326]MCE7063909.1 neutral zinc metallopeptidase [Dyadobacter sp. CY326]
MKQIKLLTTLLLFSLVLATSCQDNLEKSNAVGPQESSLAALREKISKAHASLPVDVKKNMRQTSQLTLKMHPEYRNIVLKALNVIEPTPCDGNTPINIWLDQQLSDWNSEVIGYVLDFAMLDLPTYDALVFENSSSNQYFGTSGQFTQKLTKGFKDLKRFWNIDSDGIVLAAMHGNMLLNRDRIIRTYVAAFGLDAATAAVFADIVVELANQVPQYRKGDHPIFTFNAFAQSGFDFPPYGVIPDKIIMGDGIMEGFAAIGYGDVAPQAILAHEFGHHIQFQLNLFPDAQSPEGTRRTELMADAYAAYYLSHARGASMQWKRVKQFLSVFFNIGDCSFNSDGHHGTPTQRLAAAEWAYNLANNAQKQGHILTVEQFTALFEQQLPILITK